MPEVHSPASASPTQLAGMNPPPSETVPGGDDLSSGRIPGSGSPAQTQGGAPQQGSADAKLKQDIQSLRQMQTALSEMGQSYPTATKALRAATDAIMSAQRQIVSNPGTPDPAAPNTTA